MFKRILFAFILAGACGICQAGQFYTGPSLIIQDISASHSHYRGLSPRLSLGYGSQLDQNFFLAGEFNAIFGSTEIANSDSSNSARASYSYSLSLLPGVFINENTKLYLRAGAVATRFADQNRVGMGGQMGLGLQTNMIGQWDFRTEYVYSAYQSVHDLHQPKSDLFAIGVIRKFG